MPKWPHPLFYELAQVGKDDLRLPAVIADLPCHADPLSAERRLGLPTPELSSSNRVKIFLIVGGRLQHQPSRLRQARINRTYLSKLEVRELSGAGIIANLVTAACASSRLSYDGGAPG